MKTDVNGCSTCPAGEEQWEEYYSPALRKNLVQYEYRTPDGELFSCVARNVEAARERRDAWLRQQLAEERSFGLCHRETKWQKLAKIHLKPLDKI